MPLRSWWSGWSRSWGSTGGRWRMLRNGGYSFAMLGWCSMFGCRHFLTAHCSLLIAIFTLLNVWCSQKGCRDISLVANCDSRWGVLIFLPLTALQNAWIFSLLSALCKCSDILSAHYLVLTAGCSDFLTADYLVLTVSSGILTDQLIQAALWY